MLRITATRQVAYRVTHRFTQLGLWACTTLWAGAALAQENDWTVHAKRVYTGSGDVVENAIVRVTDGKVAAILPGRSAPQNSLSVEAVTAGMIDASVRINAGVWSVEQSTEVQPQRSVADSIDVFDYRWLRAARSGVTTVYIAPLDRNVVGGTGVAMKTAGADSVDGRRLESKPIVRGAIGTDPSGGNSAAFGRPTSFFNRRPTTRMGVEWEWRKAFYDAVAAQRLPERDFEGADVMRDILAGKVRLCIQAWATQDIRTAVFLKEEMMREGFGEIDLVIDAAAEAWKEPQLLVRTKTSVILPPHPGSGRARDGAFMSINTAKVLVDAGVPVALSSHGARDAGERLAAQAGLAMRGGLTLEQALAAVTTTPARILGIEGRVGTVEVGKDADLVLWSGTPFEATARVSGVLVDGVLVHDPR
ncbi:MAG: amidohydrolase family protein [bacterium]|nr:amidohydrolase family protein [bacterium]